MLMTLLISRIWSCRTCFNNFEIPSFVLFCIAGVLASREKSTLSSLIKKRLSGVCGIERSITEHTHTDLSLN